MKRMKKLPQLHLACSQDDLRPAMQYIWIHKEVATATDGHLLVRYNLKDEDIHRLNLLHNKLIHADQWSAMVSGRAVWVEENGEDVFVHVKMTDNLNIQFKVKDYASEGYPHIGYVVSNIASREGVAVESMHFEPELICRLKRILKSSYYSSFRFKFYGQNRGCIVTEKDLPGFAIVMPQMQSLDRAIEHDSIVKELGMVGDDFQRDYQNSLEGIKEKKKLAEKGGYNPK